MKKGLKLKQFRIGKDLNQNQMADRCKVGRTTYVSIELGKSSGTIEFWHNLKNEFNLTPNEVWEMQYEGKE